MTSTLGGDDPDHDLDPRAKNALEKKLREEARKALRNGDLQRRRKLLDRAQEISREKSRKAHQGRD